MIQFLFAIPQIVLYGCLVLLVVAAASAIALFLQIRRSQSQVGHLAAALQDPSQSGPSQRREGLTLAAFDQMRDRCKDLPDAPKHWWTLVESNIEEYTSREDVNGWFLTEHPRHVLPYEIVIGKQFHSAIFSAIPGLLTGAGLTLTFVAILVALYGVHYDKANTVDPIIGIDTLINGLSGKFLSSIIALLLSICFTLYEKSAVRSLRTQYEQLLATVAEAIPFLSQSRVLLDIQRFSAAQTVSVSHISSEVVDRFVGAFNATVVPALSEGMSSSIADKIQTEFRPAMQQMNGTLDGLTAAIVSLESGKQDSVTAEIRSLVTSLESSLVNALLKMGEDFHGALTGAASQEFGNVQGTLESTRLMLADMNNQFTAVQASFAAVIEKAEQSTTDQIRSGREQTEALTTLMNGLMTRMQESADQNLGSVRAQLNGVVTDLAEKVGTLSREMMTAADDVARRAEASAGNVLERTGEWSEATARRLEGLLKSMEDRSNEFRSAGDSLMTAHEFLGDLIAQNAGALDRMADAGRQIQAYSNGLSAQTEALKALSAGQAQITGQLQETSSNLMASSEQSERVLIEYRRNFDSYKSVIDDLDQNLGKILDAIHAGLRDYNQSIENNFTEIVKISSPLISEVSNLLHTQIAELAGQLDELGSVIASSTTKVNGRAK